MNAVRRKMHKLRRPSGENDVLVITRAEFRRLRPSRNPIVMGVWAAFAVVSAMQLIRGPSPTSVNSKLEVIVQAALATVVIVGALLNLAAAWCPSDTVSQGAEIVGLILLLSAFVVYALVIAGTVEVWAASIGAAWCLGMLVGTFGRTVQIFRRGW